MISKHWNINIQFLLFLLILFIVIQELNVQLKDLQSQFIETHKYVEQLRQSGKLIKEKIRIIKNKIIEEIYINLSLITINVFYIKKKKKKKKKKVMQQMILKRKFNKRKRKNNKC